MFSLEAKVNLMGSMKCLSQENLFISIGCLPGKIVVRLLLIKRL